MEVLLEEFKFYGFWVNWTTVALPFKEEKAVLFIDVETLLFGYVPYTEEVWAVALFIFRSIDFDSPENPGILKSLVSPLFKLFDAEKKALLII